VAIDEGDVGEGLVFKLAAEAAKNESIF